MYSVFGSDDAQNEQYFCHFYYLTVACRFLAVKEVEFEFSTWTRRYRIGRESHETLSSYGRIAQYPMKLIRPGYARYT